MNSNSLLKFSKTSSIFFLLIVLFECTHKKDINIGRPLFKIEVKKEKKYYINYSMNNFDFMVDFKFKDCVKQNYEPLSDSLKVKYLINYLRTDTGRYLSEEEIRNNVSAFLIGKYFPVTFYSPAIIKVFGKDYSAIVLINFSRSNNAISGKTLYSRKSNPIAISNDTLIVTRPKYKFEFKNDGWVIQYEITTGTIKINPISKNREYCIDKVIRSTESYTSAGIDTYTLSKSRISQKFEIEDFRSY